MLFLLSISKRGGGAKWISKRRMNINNWVKKVRSNRFCPHMLDRKMKWNETRRDEMRRNETKWNEMKWNENRSLILLGWMFKNETFFCLLRLISTRGNLAFGDLVLNIFRSQFRKPTKGKRPFKHQKHCNSLFYRPQKLL